MPLLCFLYALTGSAVGSFLNVVIDRVPAGASLLRPASRCPGCGRSLSAAELVPVVSYVVLRGRCRTCGARIPLRVLLVELGAAALFALLMGLYGPTPRLLLATLMTCILLVLMVIDLEHKIVPNVIVLPAIGLALASIPLQNMLWEPPYGYYGFLQVLVRRTPPLGPTQLATISQLAGGIVGFAIFFLIWVLAPAGMGAGDVKLAAFCGLVTAIPGVIPAVFGSFLLGGLVGAALLIAGLAGRKTAIPFAPFLVVTTFVVMAFVDQLVGAYVTYLFG